MRGAAPKHKGSRFEHQKIVRACRAAGLEASRAWSSNGTTLRTTDGKRCTATVDVLVEGRPQIGCKASTALRLQFEPPLGTHVSVIREDRGQAFAIVPLGLFLRMLSKCFDHTPGGSHE